jgi:putative peptide zinc metalloprotease protein
VNPRPKLRSDLVVVEQVYRGEQSYILKDPATHKYFRFRPIEMFIMQSFEGTATFDEIAAALQEEGLQLPARAIEGFAAKLAGMGLLERSLAERTTLELERLRAERRRRQSLFQGELLRMRWSPGDPDGLLNRTLPYLRWCFTRGFVAASLVLFAAYFLVLGVAWDDFTHAIQTAYSPAALTMGTVLIVVATGFTITVIHEFGHAYACKHFGGGVHEMGLMLVYFQPAFYCNVNDAWSFPELGSRLWVTAAGGWIQFICAAVAALVWAVTVPGTLVSDVALAAMVTGGATTLVTNMNPLLPLDGYFMLSDWLEIPNLRIRALEYAGWWVRRHVLRLDLPEPRVSDRERRVFAIYGACAALYITMLLGVTASIVMGWAGRALGVAGVVLTGLLVLALARGAILTWGRAALLAFRTHRAALEASPWRKRLIGVGAVVLLLGLVVPWPITVRGAFRAQAATSLAVTAPDSGIAVDVLVREGTQVEPGAPLVRLRSLALEQERAAALGAVDSLAAEETRARARGDGALAERLAASRSAAAATLAAINERREAFTLRARVRGVVLTPRPEERVGQRYESGDTVLVIGQPDSLELRIALADGGGAAVRPGQPVRLVSYGDVARPLTAPLLATAPAADRQRVVQGRARVAAGEGWRIGTTGEASIRLRRSNLFGALWWGARKRLRADLLL